MQIDKNEFPKIVLFGHKARQGKDLFASMLQHKYEGIEITSFAKRLKEEASLFTEDNPFAVLRGNKIEAYDYINGIKKKIELSEEIEDKILRIMHKRGSTILYNMSGKDRDFLQFYGTDYKRKTIDDDYWVKECEADIIKITKTKKPSLVIVTDCRFRNEYNYFKNKYNALYAEFFRTTIEGERYIENLESNKHSSEIDLDFLYDNGKYDILVKTMDRRLEDFNPYLYVFEKIFSLKEIKSFQEV